MKTLQKYRCDGCYKLIRSCNLKIYRFGSYCYFCYNKKTNKNIINSQWVVNDKVEKPLILGDKIQTQLQGGKNNMFTQFKKENKRGGSLKENEISISGNFITFGKIADEFLDKKFVEIFVDKDNQRIAFKSSDDLIIGFGKKLHNSPSRISSITSKRLLDENNIQKGRHTFVVEDEMIVLDYKLRE